MGQLHECRGDTREWIDGGTCDFVFELSVTFDRIDVRIRQRQLCSVRMLEVVDRVKLGWCGRVSLR